MSCIGIVSAQYLPHMGGVERYTYNLSKHLLAKGDRVVVITSEAPGLKQHEVSEGIEIYRLPSYNLMNGRYPVLKPGAKLLKLQKRLDKIQFDFILINTRFYIMSVWGARYAYKRGISCAILEHGTSHLQLGSRWANYVGELVEHTLTLADKHYCKDYYGVSKACMEWSGHFRIQSKGTLYNAIDPDALPQPAIDAVDYCKKYNVPADAVKIVFTGRLIPEKGIYQLVNAIHKLRCEGKQVVLFMAGDGPEEESIRNLQIEGVFLLGRMDNAEVINLLRQMDVFCLPSVSEGFSTSVLEAAACRNYIVTTKRGGSKELIIDPTYGIIMDNNEEKNVVDALRFCIDHPKERREAVEKTYTYLCGHFTWKQTSEKVHELAKK